MILFSAGKPVVKKMTDLPTHRYTLLTKDGKIRNESYVGNDFCDHLHKVLECDIFDSQTIGDADADHIAVYFDDVGMYNNTLNRKGANFVKKLYDDSGLRNPFAHGVYGAMVFVHTYLNDEGEGDTDNNKGLEYNSIPTLVKAIRAYHRAPEAYIESRKQSDKFMKQFMEMAHVIEMPESSRRMVHKGFKAMKIPNGGMPTL